MNDRYVPDFRAELHMLLKSCVGLNYYSTMVEFLWVQVRQNFGNFILSQTNDVLYYGWFSYVIVVGGIVRASDSENPP